MTHQHRPLLRTAVRLREQYVKFWAQQGQIPPVSIGHFENTLTAARQTLKHLQYALEHGWTAAAEQLRREYARALRDVGSAANTLIEHAELIRRDVPTLRELFEELLAVQEEFEDFSIDHEESTISVLTGAIELEGVDLGRFSIELSYQAMADLPHERWFKAIAQTPCTPSHDSSITHPHVSDDRVCTGDATNPIRLALTTGRLAEFFLLVRSVLENYNDGSAYVRLSEWDGVSCTDCGEFTNPNNLCYCEGCESEYCSECMRSCVDCAESRCRNCLTQSELTRKWVCSCCEASCEDCGRTCEASELSHQGLCDDCQQAVEEQDQEDNDSDEAAEPNEAATPPLPLVAQADTSREVSHAT